MVPHQEDIDAAVAERVEMQRFRAAKRLRRAGANKARPDFQPGGSGTKPGNKTAQNARKNARLMLNQCSRASDPDAEAARLESLAQQNLMQGCMSIIGMAGSKK